MPRYVILTHDHPRLHWDLLLEEGDALRSWRLLSEPAAGGASAAEAIPDHRLMYLDYEGPVSGGRGRVQQWDRGVYSAEADDGGLTFRLEGRRGLTSAKLTTNSGRTVWTFA